MVLHGYSRVDLYLSNFERGNTIDVYKDDVFSTDSNVDG